MVIAHALSRVHSVKRCIVSAVVILYLWDIQVVVVTSPCHRIVSYNSDSKIVRQFYRTSRALEVCSPPFIQLFHPIISAMASSLFCLLVLVLAFVGNVSAARTLPKSEPEFRAAMMRRLHKNGPPDLLAMKNAQATAVQRYTVTYTSAGYITSGLYSDSTCSTMQLAFGTPVNTCFVNEGYAYMFRLVQSTDNSFLWSAGFMLTSYGLLFSSN